MTQISLRALRMAIVESISELTGRSAQGISDTDDLVDDLGVDSMATATLLVAIEDRVGASVPDGSEGRLAGLAKVGELVERLASVYEVEG